MAHIDKHIAKDGTLTYRFKVYRGRDPITGKQLTPYSMTWEPPATWSEETCDKKAPAEAAKFEQRCKDGKAAVCNETFYNYAIYAIELLERLGRKHKTICGYEHALSIVSPYIGHITINNLTPKHLNKMYADLMNQDSKRRPGHKNSPSSVLKYHRFVSSVLSIAESEEAVSCNVAKKAKPPSLPKHNPVYYQPETVVEIARHLETEPLKWKVITHLYLITGKRRGEIAGLEWHRIDLKNGLLDISKALLYTPKRGIYIETLKEDNAHYVKIPPETVNLLKLYRSWWLQQKNLAGDRWAGTDFVFIQKFGSPIYPGSINKWMSKFSKKYDLPKIHPHAFRHTLASLLYYNGFDSVTVAGQLGHKNVSTTENIYAHVISKSRALVSDAIANTVYRVTQGS